ncbi:MAG: DUF1579 family protein [Acidobacteria bacterium]|nr:DUF1579 family protein [Acidobacteriota bacterium]
MRKTFVLMIGIMAAAAATAAAQPPAAPKPGAEHKRLDYFVGKWTTTGDMKPSPFGPGGKVTMNDSCEWFQGGFAVVCNSQGTGPMGPTKGLGIMSYSPDLKAYTYYGVDNTGMIMTTVPRGHVQGDTWTFDDESMMGGQKIKSRYVLKITSPMSYSFRWEMAGPDGKWMPVMEGTSTKGK